MEKHPYIIGDIVKVKYIIPEKTKYDDVVFVEEMDKYKGGEFEIIDIVTEGYIEKFKLKGTNSNKVGNSSPFNDYWVFTQRMIEPVTKENYQIY